MNARYSGALLGCLLSLLGCTNMPVIEQGACGNAIIEKDEDCDTFPAQGGSCRQPGSTDACHFDCSLGADGKPIECPAGYGCTAGGVCRKPTGEFDAPVNLAPGVSSWLSTADFDGDHRQDLISTEPADELRQARFRIHYFDADAKLEETRTFPRVVTRPIARQLTAAQGDSAEDLIFSNDLIGMVRGRADREWIPATFSSYVLPGTRLRAVALRADGVGEAIGLAVFTSLEEGPGVYVPSLDSAKLSLRARLKGRFEDLAGQPIAAELVTGVDSPCSEVVFAFLGDDAVHVLDLCQLGSAPFGPEVLWREAANEQVLRLPRGSKVSSAPLTGDVDGDGDLDVLVGSNDQTFVAHGDGARLEDEMSRLMIPALDDGKPFAVSTLLAAGDFTGDGAVDFVLPGGILVSHTNLVDGRLGYFEPDPSSGQPWSMAVIADLNANGLPDVIAGTAGAPGLWFLSGTGGPYLIQTRLGTQGPLRFLTTGDFDGDRIIDVAVVQDGPPRSGNDSLAVAFGQRDSFPLAVRPIAELAGVQQLSSAVQAGVASIFVTSKEKAGGVTRCKFTLFDGSPDRLPFAPYSLVTFSVDGSLHDSLARVLAAGSFTAPGSNDLFVIGGEGRDPTEWSLWLVPDIGGGGEPPRRLAPDTVPPRAIGVTFYPGGGQLSAAAAAADLDGDGVDEALVLMPQGVDDCVLMIYDIDGANSTATSKGVVNFGVPCPDPELSSADFDGDHRVDLIALVGDKSAGPRQLRVLFNHDGGFSLEDAALVGVPGHDVRAFSLLAKGSAGMAFVTDDGLYAVAKHPYRSPRFDNPTRLHDFDDTRSVVVTDPGGDGIEDIAVADAAGLWLVKAQLQ